MNISDTFFSDLQLQLVTGQADHLRHLNIRGREGWRERAGRGEQAGKRKGGGGPDTLVVGWTEVALIEVEQIYRLVWTGNTQRFYDGDSIVAAGLQLCIDIVIILYQRYIILVWR